MTPMTDDQIKETLHLHGGNTLVVRIVRAVEAHHAPGIADLQNDLARYMAIAGDESERADAAEADKAAAVEATLDAAHEYLVATYGHSPLAHPVDRGRVAAIERTAKP